MKITNVTVGYLLWTAFSAVWIIHGVSIDWVYSKEMSFGFFMLLFFSGISSMVWLVYTLNSLLSNDVEFEFTILNPLSAIASYYKKKREVEKKKAELYDKLFKAQTESEIDLINKKLEMFDN